MTSAESVYDQAVSRNLGWVTPAEQLSLRSKRIAIAGLGGVGGSHLLTLTRLGIGKFHLSDFDVFEPANFNRQAGATLSTVGRPKLDVMLDAARDINPELEIESFEQGVNAENVDAFLDGVDVYIDGLDFFAVAAREAVFNACEKKGIPAVTVAPLGMGAAMLVFKPGGMTFEQYFGWAGQSELEKLLRFLVGLAPAHLHAGYLVDPSSIDLANHKGPSTAMGCELSAGIAATQALKLALGRGDVIAAPWGMHFDAYRNKLKRTWRPGGHRNPLQQLALRIARNRFSGMLEADGQGP